MLPRQPTANRSMHKDKRTSTSFISEKLSRLDDGFDTPEPVTVLLVEDSLTVRMQLRHFISQLDSVDLVEVETLTEARRLLESGRNDFFCAILDLTLPDASGSEIVDVVRAYGIPVIVLSGSVDAEIRKAMRERRVIDYIVKSSMAAIEDVAYLVGRLRQNRKMTVMVVDDSSTVRTHLSILLEQYQFSVITAKNGREALESLRQHPDTALILTDYHMPEMNGVEMIRQIRLDQRREDLAIIAISSESRPDIAPTMIKAGANDFLSKPFQPEEFYCRVVQNINMVRYVRQLRDMANRDYLTRLYNRRHLFKSAEICHAEAALGKCKLALAIVDADHFKRINDRYGHAAGDRVLRKIADTMRTSLPHNDILARYGGEEFVCVLSLENEEDAAIRLEALRHAIETFNLNIDGTHIPVTVSIGFTVIPGKSLAEMIEMADQALYQAKEAGRNRIVQAMPT